MKIAIFDSQDNFTVAQQKKLSNLGKVYYSNTREVLSIDKILELVKDANILAPDPDNLGGFEKSRLLLTKVMDTLPKLYAVCLSTTSFGWVDLHYCKKRNIAVSNIPGYSRETVAEHSLAMLLNLAKKIIVTDRRTQKGNYKMEMGFELKGKTLGIIGLGNIGSRVAELAQGIGMRVISFNRSPKKMKGVNMKESLEELLKEADAISIHTTHENKNNKMLGKKEISLMKRGVAIVNTVDRDLFDEEVLAEAIKSGQISGYTLETEDLDRGPLAGLENAVLLRGFGWYTKEALENLYQIWVENIVASAKDTPQNLVKV